MQTVARCALILLAASVALAKIQVSLPNTHTEWVAGTTAHIKWKPVDEPLKGKLSIELMEGADPTNLESVTTIAENIPAVDQEVKWTIPKNLKSSSNYAIKIVDDDGEEYYGRFFKGMGGKTDVVKRPSGGSKGEAHNAGDAKGAAGERKADSAKANNSAAKDEKEPQTQAKGAGNDGDEKSSETASARSNGPLGMVVLGSIAALALSLLF